MRRSSWIGVVLVVAWGSFGLAGCGDDMGTDAGGGGMDAGGGGTDAGGGGTDAGGGADGGGAADGGGGGDGGGSGDGGGTMTDGGGTMTDGGGGAVGVACGMMRCGPTEQCCTSGFGGGAMTTCIARDATCMGVTRACDGPEDCMGGQVCCAARNTGGGGGGARCTAAAECMGITQLELCHTVADCSTSGEMCCPGSMFIMVDGYCAMTCFGIGPTP
ncbi:MAG: hypothetical protein AB7S26_00670 [Sandaracinaceae bacterium]